MRGMPDTIVKYRWMIIFGLVAMTLLLGSRLRRVEFESDFASMIPKTMGYRASTDQIEDIFGGTDMLIVLFETDDVLKPATLTRLKNIAKAANRIDGVDKVISLFDMKTIKGENGKMIVEPVVKRIPQREEQREQLRREIIDNDLVYNVIVSKNFNIACMILTMRKGVEDADVVTAVQQIVNDYPGDEKVSYGGIPYTRFRLAIDMRQDMFRLMPLGLLIMLVFLLFAFKQVRGMALPFCVVVMSIVVTLGLVPLLGWKIYVPTILVPVILIAVANDYGIHLIAKFQEDNVEGHTFTRAELAKRMFASLVIPVFLTGLTTIAGLLCLLTHILIPAKQLGVLSAIGIAFALVASLLLIPAATTLLNIPKPVVHFDDHKKHLLDRFLTYVSYLVTTRPKAMVIGSAVFVVLVGFGVVFIRIDSNPENYYPKDHPLVQTSTLINENFGGSQNVSLVFTGDIKSPELMKKIEHYGLLLESYPQVGKTISIAHVIKQMSRALNDSGDVWYDKIPEDRNAIAQYFELYAMSGDPDDFENQVDFTYENAQLVARIKSLSTRQLYDLEDKLEQLQAADVSISRIGGFALIFSQLAHLMMKGQILSLFLALGLVTLLLMVLFRSFWAGIMSGIPLAAAIFVLFGLMGYFGITLNIATTMLSSIMIGVGIDYTIHFVWRLKQELAGGLDAERAVKRTITTTGRGITFNALSVIVGFSVLLLSNFTPIRFFGFLVFVSILACLVGAMVLIPAIALVFKPKFLQADN